MRIRNRNRRISITNTLTITRRTAFSTINTNRRTRLNNNRTNTSIIINIRTSSRTIALISITTRPFSLINMSIQHNTLRNNQRIRSSLIIQNQLPSISRHITSLRQRLRLNETRSFQQMLRQPLNVQLLNNRLLSRFHNINNSIRSTLLILIRSSTTRQQNNNIMSISSNLLHPTRKFRNTNSRIFTNLNRRLSNSIIQSIITFSRLTSRIRINVKDQQRNRFSLLRTSLRRNLRRPRLLHHIRQFSRQLITITRIKATPSQRLNSNLQQPNTIKRVSNQR